MPTTYMINNWSEVSRDERFFCAELFQIIKQNKRPFSELLTKKGIIKSIDVDYEVGYEVCFYRDYICKYGYKKNHKIKTIKKLIIDGKDADPFPPKRTFDLCLFLENKIIIIEAKAQQGFTTKQLKEFNDDRIWLKELLNIEDKNIIIIGLYSSNYTPSQSTLSYFKNEGVKEGYLNWNEIYQIYSRQFEILKRADDCFAEKCSDKKSNTEY